MDTKNFDIVEISDSNYEYHYRPYPVTVEKRNYTDDYEDSAEVSYDTYTDYKIPTQKKFFKYCQDHDQENHYFYYNADGEKIYGRKVVYREDAVCVEERAFRKDISITEVILNDGMLSIGQFAFDRCRSLYHVEIPDSVVHIGEGAFWGCKNLKNVVIPEGVVSIESHAFIYCTSLESIVIPRSVRFIGSGAFYGCTNLKSIVILGHISRLTQYEFHGCEKLKRILIYNDSLQNINVNSISKEIYSWRNPCPRDIFEFLSKSKIQSFVWSNKNIYYNKGDTLSADSPTNNPVYVPDPIITVRTADQDILLGKKISKEPKNSQYNNYYIFSDQQEWVLKGYDPKKDENIPNEYTLEDGTLTLSDKERMVKKITFEKIKDQIRHVIIPENVTIIGRDAFSDCTLLESVAGPKNGICVQSGAFRNCESLKTLPNLMGTVVIGNETFAGCKSLEKITIPDGVVSISENAFCGCINLKQVESYLYYSSLMKSLGVEILIRDEKSLGFPLCRKPFNGKDEIKWKDFTLTYSWRVPIPTSDNIPILTLRFDLSQSSKNGIINMLDHNIIIPNEKVKKMLDQMMTYIRFWNTNPVYPYTKQVQKISLEITAVNVFTLNFYDDEDFLTLIYPFRVVPN